MSPESGEHGHCQCDSVAGRNLGIKTIAEGVETEDHIDFLREIGCTAIQGHYLSKPMTAKVATDFLNTAMSDRMETVS